MGGSIIRGDYKRYDKQYVGGEAHKGKEGFYLGRSIAEIAFWGNSF